MATDSGLSKMAWESATISVQTLARYDYEFHQYELTSVQDRLPVACTILGNDTAMLVYVEEWERLSIDTWMSIGRVKGKANNVNGQDERESE